MQVVNHKLVGEGVLPFDLTKKTSGNYAPGAPDTIIIHYTAGDSTQVAVNVLKDPKVQASAHMVVGLQGEVVQLADLNVITWHAGTSAYSLPTDPKRGTFNKYSIGIEISNPGYLVKRDDKYYTWYNKVVPKELVYEGKHANPITTATLWYKYPEVQLKRVFDICKAMIEAYPSIKYILGHDEICPGRKTDPGPAFPLNELRKQMNVWIPGSQTAPKVEPAKPGSLIGYIAHGYLEMDNSDMEGDAIITATILNLRSSPEINDKNKIAQLRKGDKVLIIEDKDNWIKVSVLASQALKA